MEYVSAKELADKLNISEQSIEILCSDNKINNAKLVDNIWFIPTNTVLDITNFYCKPFLKWVGGKNQLISEIENYYPFNKFNVTKYCEPFIGGGAILFDILNKYNLKEIYISDINKELITTYISIRDNVFELIDLLADLENKYLSLTYEERKLFYSDKRDRFNMLKMSDNDKYNLEKSSLMIFLNKTCFNGLYRVNKKGFFNVPMGKYKNPTICDKLNLLNVSIKLQNVKIVCSDYKNCLNFVDNETFVYIDPPYKPITTTSSFTAYNDTLFLDQNQLELKDFVNVLDKKGAKIVISNSDPKSINSDDTFFDDIYSNFIIKRVDASRMINCKGDARGKIKELIISNFVIK